MSNWLTRKQAAEFIKARIHTGSVSLLARLARTGEGPKFYTAGKAALYAPEDIEEWLAHRQRPKGQKPTLVPDADLRSSSQAIADPVSEAFELLRNLGISA